jgi:aspartyl-tRNA(Asn)/glutamyl-tRNA(Gln) amidotransferase subunit A
MPRTMSTPDPSAVSIGELAARIRSGRATAAGATEACLERVARDNPTLNAFIAVLADEARGQARQADEELSAGRDRGPLHGVPVSLKDLIDLEGVPTTAASRVRAAHVADRDAKVVTRLRRAGAVLMGKCNLHEFAFGTTSEDSAFGPVLNPVDPSRSAGGSSGGSAVAVVTGMSFASIGTDTGGSIRIPAAACGCVGLKPSYGEIPADGIVPLSHSLDHVGPLARCVDDAWFVYHAIAGTPAVGPLEVDDRIRPDRLRLGLLERHFCDVLDDGVRAAFEAERTRLERAGARIVDVEIPHAHEISSVYLHIQLPEASAYHASVLERRPGDYTPSVRLRLEMGRYVLAEDYVRALEGRELLRREVDAALEGCDALLLPTLPIPAPPLGATSISLDGRNEPVRGLMLRQTQLFDLTGHPAITLPCSLSASGMPCGFQLVGRRGETARLLRMAGGCENR